MENKKYSFEFKVKLVNEYLNNEGGYTHISRKYNIERSLLRRWMDQYNQYGYQGAH